MDRGKGKANRREKGRGWEQPPENTRAQGSRVAVYKQRNAGMYIQTAAERNRAGVKKKYGVFWNDWSEPVSVVDDCSRDQKGEAHIR